MQSTSLAGRSILIVEDEPLIAIGIADAFTTAGARVVQVQSLKAALVGGRRHALSRHNRSRAE
jgi:DNA-binding response OmpR family regulator